MIRFRTIVADTSGLFSLFSANDRNHQIAIDESRRIEINNDLFLIPSDVITELVNILGKKVGHPQALKRAKQIIGNYEDIVESTDFRRMHALQIFSKQKESVSFTDCIVMAVASEYKTRYIFGFDDAFHKNGYTRLGIDS